MTIRNICVLFVLALTVSTTATSQTNWTAKADNPARIEAQLARLGRVDIIVEVKGPAVSSAADNADHTKQIRTAQDAFLTAFFGTANDTALAGAGRAPKRMLLPTDRLDRYPRRSSEACGRRARSAYPIRRVDIADGRAPFTVTGASAALGTMGASGLNQIVAVIDTGFETEHRALSGSFVAESCFSNNSVDWLTTCRNGTIEQHGIGAAKLCTNHPDCIHGTQVAGLITGVSRIPYWAGPSDQVVGTQYGLAPYAALYGIQAYSLNLPTGKLQATWTNLQRALERVYVMRNSFAPRKIAAVNISLGTKDAHDTACDDHVLAPIIKLLRQAGIATVIAAGNESIKTQVSEPGCISDAITVAASTLDDKRTTFFQYG